MTRSRHHSRYFEHFLALLRSSSPLSQGTRSQGSLVSLSVQMQIIYPGTALMHLKKGNKYICIYETMYEPHNFGVALKGISPQELDVIIFLFFGQYQLPQNHLPCLSY